MKTAKPVIGITCGEPAGIGPEISLRAAHAMRAEWGAQSDSPVRIVLIGDAGYLAALAGDIDPALRLSALSMMAVRNAGIPDFPNAIPVIDCPTNVPIVPGQLEVQNGMHVLHMLDAAIEGAQAGWLDAIVTAPLQKSVINEAGVPFTGHTEYLAQKTGTKEVVMMLAGGGLRVALATTHLPLKDVPAAITRASLAAVLDIVHADLRGKFGIAAPRILVTGLNPHAGESGHMGREEIETIEPAIAAAKARGIDARGPYPADTLFQEKYLRDADCVLAMYHDQGLPVLKHASFGRGVNITLGLPIIRTSVDHGTALDLAAQGLGLADDGSLREALRVARQMVNSRAESRT